MRLCLPLLASVMIACLHPFQALAFGPEDGYPDIEHDEPLSEAELRAAFTGQKHLGSYNFLSRDIKVYAFEETTHSDGTIRHVQQGKVDTGQWSIKDNIICYDYDDPGLYQACFRMYVRGNCYYHYQVSVEGYPRFGFSARSVIAGETPSCEPSLV